MEINENDLGKVAGGTAVETKEGKWILTPPDAKTFDTKEAAEEAEKEFMGKHGHGHHHGHGPHRGGFMPPMGQKEEGPNFGPEGPEQE